uniref:Uncharacterized protein n=1 Tax=Molossus molossus TaxID=27622 RepID=A0A7J8J128_MOLMO|nr:hypothetical protein HJG59_010254 [Molossus molossus]
MYSGRTCELLPEHSATPPTPPPLRPTDCRTCTRPPSPELCFAQRASSQRRNKVPWISFIKNWFPRNHLRTQNLRTRWRATEPSEIPMVQATQLGAPWTPVARGKAGPSQRAGLLLCRTTRLGLSFIPAIHRQVQGSFFPPNTTFFVQRNSGL